MDISTSDNILITKLREENEQATNKTVALFLLLFIAVVPLGFVITILDYAENIAYITRYVVLPLGILLIVVEVIAFSNKFKGKWIKFLLMIGLTVSCAIHFFVYGMYVFYLVFIPILVATRYFDEKFIIHTTAISFTLTMLSMIMNTHLDSRSEVIKMLHEEAVYNIWAKPKDAVVYLILPVLVVTVFVVFYAISITSRGKKLIKMQADDREKIASVNAELEMASEIQMSALPPQNFTTENNHFSLFAGLRTAKEVGGDFYDYFMVDENIIAIVMADVSDKGAPAAMFMMSAKKTIRCLSRATKSLKEACNMVNKMLCEDNKSGMFLTVWAAVIDIHSGKGKFVNAGHTQPMIKHPDGSIERLENEPNLFMGLFPDANYEPGLVDLKPGDSLVLYTDGVTDAMNSIGESFGETRLRNAIAEANDNSRDICQTILNEIDIFATNVEQFDDITLMTLHCENTDEPVENEFMLTGDNESLEKALDEIDNILSECPDMLRRNVNTVIDEIYTNTFDYAITDENETLIMKTSKGNNCLDIVFEYNAVEFDPTRHEDPNVDDQICLGGLGIYLIKNLTDSMDYEHRNGTNVLKCGFIWDL